MPQGGAGFKFDVTARAYKCFNEELPHDYEFAGRWSAAVARVGEQMHAVGR